MANREVKTDSPSFRRGGEEESGRFAYDGLERLIHEKARLGIMTSLAAHSKGLLFNDLKELCALTDGNLSRHLQLLQESGLVEIWKGVRNNRSQTLCRITEAGRKRFLEYIAVLESVIADAADAAKVFQPATKDMLKGWSPA
jgi:DNA-binding MarR family transcriptional regulator